MKATERCSCGGEFTAGGRGAAAALLEWRETHQHSTSLKVPSWWGQIPGPYVPPASPTMPWDQVWAGHPKSVGSGSAEWRIETPPTITYATQEVPT